MEMNRRQLIQELLEYTEELQVKVNGQEINDIYLSDDGYIMLEGERNE